MESGRMMILRPADLDPGRSGPPERRAADGQAAGRRLRPRSMFHMAVRRKASR